GQLLEAVTDSWQRDRGRVLEAAGRITTALVDQRVTVVPGVLDRDDVTAALDAGIEALAIAYDGVRGGFGRAPKFPPS
ncbi:hypothetical protein K9B40_25525, partial [Klebsiella aerogenes]